MTDAKSKKDLNTASFYELMGVPEIGEVLSARIIINRPFKHWQDVEALFNIGSVRIGNLKARFIISAVGEKGDSHCEKDEAEHVRKAEDEAVSSPSVASPEDDAVSRSAVGPSPGVFSSFGCMKKCLEIKNGLLSTMSIRPPRKTLS